MSMAQIDKFLSLKLIKSLLLSFRTAKQLQGRAELLPTGPQWKCCVIPTTPHLTKHKVRLFCEWMTGEAACKMQSQLPPGATLLRVILLSDKTNVSDMTGGCVVHPLLLSLVNIKMQWHNKASSNAFLLIALLPITKFIHPVERSCSHPPQLGSVTLSQLATIKSAPEDMGAYFAECVQYHLNGMDKPFWWDWTVSDLSQFLTPEPLHHWHREFYDHDMKWCLNTVSPEELDFQFSILQPVTCYPQFKDSVSKLKQVTGRAQHDMQCYIVALIASIVPPAFVKAICTMSDFWYCSQAPILNNTDCICIVATLKEFHDNKNIIIALGAHQGAQSRQVLEHWEIPKLELMQSIALMDHKNKNKNQNDNNDDDIYVEPNETHPSAVISNLWPTRQSIQAAQPHGPLAHSLQVDEVSVKFLLPDLCVTLADYFSWEVRIQAKSFHVPSVVLPMLMMNAAPPSGPWKFGHYDAAIFTVDKDMKWPHSGLNETRLIMQPLPPKGMQPAWSEQFLAYIERFDMQWHKQGSQVDPATGMQTLKHATHSSGVLMGDILPLDQLQSFTHIIPTFGLRANT
ncbi:hypothetical protein PAXRUDRAFT_28568 [Paxillus rubicundulus Ve08.2h10]|uniref:DUF6830 domain-containing protein n=1 Tax=Paxillus rubicundulus Ve08.2h10 TaxID=930991 RepID=A0A0D0D4W2_9AGAM|nr:hypothetical protein PAXRUDRAFT_28568 [Paxillus rubicundulus Ve08.2h10]